MSSTLAEATSTAGESLEEQESKLTDNAMAAYLAAGVRKKAAKEKLKELLDYCQDRGVNANRQIERHLQREAAAAQNAAASVQTVAVVPPPAVAAEPAPKAANDEISAFVKMTAAASKADGFTILELVKAASLAGLIERDSKENRQPFYTAVMEDKNAGILVEAKLKRNDQTVFVLK